MVKNKSTIPNKELDLEIKRLNKTLEVIKNKISELGQEFYEQEEKITEFKRFIWDNQTEMDPTEMKSLIAINENEIYLALKRADYFKKLYKIQNNPYFGSIIFKGDDNKKELIYIGLTHLLDEKDNHLIYDWRSPISSLFYDYELGPCAYDAPMGIIKGEVLRKRQYKIENGQLVHVFDNSLSVDDEVLQQVLASNSSEKMKNIVNTIQQEQNKVIRNITDKNIIVQGIAGSGKTSVALHRIAFLLYKLENLESKNVLIFSPNQVFSEYISNVLPELGEENTMQTTFHDFLKSIITEYESVESFVEFISRYYQKEVIKKDLVVYKQSDQIIFDLIKYVKYLNTNIKFTKDIKVEKHLVTKEELNEYLKRYSKLPIFNRLEVIAEKLSEINYKGSLKKKGSFYNQLKGSFNLNQDYKKIYGDFFKSEYARIKLNDDEISYFIKRDKIFYEDALLFTFIKGLLESFNYQGEIKHVVIDEAQDYSKIQYIIIAKIFKSASLTILGDINQTINPYYQYESLNNLAELFGGSTCYLELTKSYRSSQEIIEYSNQILGLDHVSAIRIGKREPVIRKNAKVLREDLIEDINELQKQYSSIAIITKDHLTATDVYEQIKNEFDVSLILESTMRFNKKLVVIPVYMAKGLEFDSVIVINKINNPFTKSDKYLMYVALTRAQHKLIIYN